LSTIRTQPNSQTVQTPDSKKLHRLARAAGSYLGLSVGDPLPIEEIIEQAKANGYGEARKQVHDLLEKEGYATADSIPVPPQGDAFGELWRPSAASESDPEPTSEPVRAKGNGTLQHFRDWCEERASNDKTHSYTRQQANRKYARAKDVDRNFVREYDEFSTALITYCRQRDGESLAEHAENFYPRQITQKRRRILKREGVYESMAGVSLLAPRVPSPNALTTHAHDFLWLPSHIEGEAFDPLQEVEGFDVEISVENHISSEVNTPESVKARGSADSPRGDTTALPQELGANLPMLTCRFDARGAPDYVEKWAAAMREGTDGSFSTAGVRRFRKLKAFADRADSMKARRKVEDAHGRAENLCQTIEYLPPSHSQDHSSPDSYDSTEGEGGSCLPEGKGEGDTDHPTESRFTFKEYD